MKQTVIITVGYQRFVLPDDNGVATVIKCLSKAIPCSYLGSMNELRLDRDPSLEVSMQYLPRGVKIVDYEGNPLPGKPAAKPMPGVRKLKPQHVRELGWNNDPKLL